jgi:hypothetical protein
MDIEKENTRLRKLVADLSLDNSILREVSKETSKPDQTCHRWRREYGGMQVEQIVEYIYET